MPLQQPSPLNCYCIIGGDQSRLWSSSAQAYVSPTDPTYLNYALRFLTLNHTTETSLSVWLDQYGVIGPVVLPKVVDREAYRRISTGFVFGEKSVQMRDELLNGVQKNDQINICAQAVLAHDAIKNGAQPGNYNWLADGQPFVWRAADNSFVQLDAFQMVELSNAAARWKRLCTWAASALKDMQPIPRDFADNKYWPQ